MQIAVFSKHKDLNFDTLNDCQLIRWTHSALLSFIFAGLLGLLMRLAFVYELPEWINYSHIKHAHSHVAMLGWLYSGLFIFIVHNFRLYHKIYKTLFWLTQISILGMLIGFWFQGYAAVSISFSALHIFLSYAFIINVFRDLKSTRQKGFAVKFLKAALLFMFVSTLGIWAIGPILNMSEGRSALYYGAIQFFLHFQFNGWFIFAIIALFLKLMEQKNVSFDEKKMKGFFSLLTVSCIFSFALAITWSTPEHYIFWINSFGVVIQFVALYFLIKLIWPLKNKLKRIFSPWVFLMLSLSFVALIIKIAIQTLVAIPDIATISYTVRNFVIGFIHLLMLGSLSLFLIAMISIQIAEPEKSNKIGIYIFLSGFTLSELLLFVQGVFLWGAKGFIPYYDISLFISSLFMILGIIIYFFRLFNLKLRV